VKQLRDILIIVVLGGVVIWALTTFIGNMNDSRVSHSLIVGQAQQACEEDERICNFTSEESAQAYLDSPEHLVAVKARQAQSDQTKKGEKAGRQ
jgi:hypothetical protein